MPIILVVDDSGVDRLRAGRLLQKAEEEDWIIEYAGNGQEALSSMRDLVPDVVVTDLQMPEMDGLELVDAVRKEFPQVPVILTTGQGSETLALKALEHGAASYVPKSQLADKLLDTVKQVLAVARASSGFQRLTECFLQNELSLELSSDPTLIPPLVDLAQQMLSNMRFADATERLHLGMALEEALLNAIYHGTLELPTGQAQEARSASNQGQLAACVQERLAQAAYCDRKVFVAIRINGEAARFVVRDQGQGFAQSAVPRPGDPESLERGGGRGLILMKNFMDDVHFNASGNEVTMSKRRAPGCVIVA
jgi:CheY-like chemotaxis protein/anti-sigma regulatory factor (Ser/Thr protein kinase)